MKILLYLKDKTFLSNRSQELLNICSFFKKKQERKLYVALSQKAQLLSQNLEDWDIDKIFYLEDKKDFDYINTAASLEIIIEKEEIDLVLMGNNIYERELAPYLVAKLDWEYIANTIAFDLQAENIVWKRFLYGTKAIEESESAYSRLVVTLSPNIFKKDERSRKKNIVSELVKSDSNKMLAYVLKNREKKKIQKTSLEQAKIVIGVGKGIASKENFATIEELAELTGATIGVTRAVVDHGWRPEYEKIGQTGKIIKPELYLGFGISGAMQHIVGAQKASHIVMVNNNPNAEVFRSSDLGLVPDLFSVLTYLIQKLKAEKQKKET